MKTRTLPLLLVVLSLAMSSLACSLFSGSEADSSDEVETPEVVPTRKIQPTIDAAPTDALLPEQPSSLLPDLSIMMPAVDTNGDGTIDICEAVPVEVWEMVMSRSMVGEPTPFDDPSLGNGCAFDFGSDAGAAYFSYVTIASEKQFNDALASAVNAEPVTTVGDSAFLNSGPDARQLWVRAGDKAVMVAIGEQENVEGMMVVAPFLLLALP
jgi:hypothetical protein